MDKYMAITPLPDPPSRADSTNFAQRGDAFMAALPPFVIELNALAADVTAKQSTASAAAVTAIEQAGIATNKAGQAAASEGVATTKAGEAATSEAAALAYKGAAATSASNASDSEAAAAASAASVDAKGFATDYAGPAEPPVMWTYMTWADTGNMLLKRRNAAGSAWVTLGPLLEELAKKVGDAAQRFKASPSAAANEVTVQSQVPGVGQTLQDLTASRAAGAPYINSTGKEIKVFIAGTTTSASGAIAGKLSGTYYVATAERGGSGLVLGINFPVPDGVTYMVEAIGASIGAWLEERG